MVRPAAALAAGQGGMLALLGMMALLLVVASAAGPMEVIDALGKIKGKEELGQFVRSKLKGSPADRGKSLSI